MISWFGARRKLYPTVNVTIDRERREQLCKNATIGILTALPHEFAAMRVMLDDAVSWTAPGKGAGLRFLLSEVPASQGGAHTVAVTLMPDMGNNTAAVSATKLLGNLPNVQHVIMCGIAGGVPTPGISEDDVRLGDVVVSNRHGVVQYDLVKEHPGGATEHRYPPRPPGATLLEAVRYLEADALVGRHPWVAHLQRQGVAALAPRPKDGVDARGEPIDYPPDPARVANQPRIFSGTVASANTLLKNPEHRDYLAKNFNVKAVEMEGSGVADAIWMGDAAGYLVVRGICDYCDGKNGDVWQKYAAAAAAAYTRALIESMAAPAPQTSKETPPDSPGWARVCFENQRGLKAALSGESLGPRDVTACPRLAEVSELHSTLGERNYAALVGPSGSGKSLAIFQVAHDLSANGVAVYRLIDFSVGVANIRLFKGKKVLLIVDDAHRLPRQAIATLCDSAADERKILLAGIDSIAGFTRPINVNVKRVVTTLAEEMTKRIDEVREVVRQIDRRIGEGYFDTPIERILESAAESKAPWQYMFVLGCGHLRCRKALANLQRVDRAELVLLILSMGQIARYDNVLERDVLVRFAHSYQRDEAWLDASLKAIDDQGLLVREGSGRFSTPHPRLAMAAIALTLRPAWSIPAIQRYLNELLVDKTLPLRGRAWLIEELRFLDGVDFARIILTLGAQENLYNELKNHDGTNDSIAASIRMLRALVWRASSTMGLLKTDPLWLVELIYGAERVSGYELSALVNDIHNNDSEWGQAFVNKVDAPSIAHKIVVTEAQDFGAIVALVDRLIQCGSIDWGESFFGTLDCDLLAARWRKWSSQELHAMAEFSGYLVSENTNETRQLIRSMYPIVRRAFHECCRTG